MLKRFINALKIELFDRQPQLQPVGQLDEYEGEILWAQLQEDEKKWREQRNVTKNKG